MKVSVSIKKLTHANLSKPQARRVHHQVKRRCCNAANYNPNANVDDGSCNYTVTLQNGHVVFYYNSNGTDGTLRGTAIIQKYRR